MRLAGAYYDAGRFREGIATLDRLFEINRWASDSYGLQARMLVQTKEFDRCARAAERAIEINPSLRATYRSLAELNRLRGDLPAAETWYDKFQRFPAQLTE